ncbi:MAG TPA: NAD(P)/FAD-dependent oxidoreductase [Terriglobales bacterium]|jgi:salicylate hydroxylase|nr:NAD(P)/FAD-dependent oxidoreductase [Terriglobales bacterium]
MDVAIFGAGIAGLTAAITLQAQGHQCRVYERLRQGHETGMGFILLPEAAACLARFGVHLAGALSGVPLRRYCCRNAAGEIVHELPLPAGTLSIRRHDLIAALMEALPAGETLTFDAELAGLEFNENKRVTSARLNSGERIRADLYIAADGIRSHGRRALFPHWPVEQAQVLEVVGLARCKDTIRWAGSDFNKFHAGGGGIALGVLPADREHVVWYLQFDANRFPSPSENGSATPVAKQAFVENLVGGWAEPIPHLLAITDFARVYLWRPMDTDLVPHFYQGNLVLVGDAAHPFLPFTSQGVSAAIADAVTLARAMHGKAMNSEAELAAALAHYSNERREQCVPYIAKGRELAQHFLTPQVLSGALLPVA